MPRTKKIFDGLDRLATLAAHRPEVLTHDEIRELGQSALTFGSPPQRKKRRKRRKKRVAKKAAKKTTKKRKLKKIGPVLWRAMETELNRQRKAKRRPKVKSPTKDAPGL